MAAGRFQGRMRRLCSACVHRRTDRRPPVMLTLITALAVALFLVRIAERRLRPSVAVLAQIQVRNQVASILENAAAQALKGVEYGDLVAVQRDDNGNVASLTVDAVAMNRLRSNLTIRVLEALEPGTPVTIRIPLGNLVSSELTWSRGPSFVVRATAVGTPSARFESDFSAAGVNQTRHRIDLELSVPMKLLLPGGPGEVVVEVSLPAAETVIVGQVPETHFQLDGLPASG